MTRHLKKILLFLNFFTVCIFSGCTKASDFGADADYFIGLQRLEEGKEDEAREKLLRCVKKGSYWCAKRSAQMLTTMGTIQERNSACRSLLQKFPGEDSLLITVRQLYSSNEIGSVVQLTDGIDFSTASDELVKIRLMALAKQGSSRLVEEAYSWFTVKKISTEHYQFFRDVYSVQYINQESPAPQDFAISYRIDIYRRNYLSAFENAPVLFEYFSQNQLTAVPELASDIGKAYLYGSEAWYTNAALFRKKAQELANTPVEFYFWFYSGRIFEQGGIYYANSINCYKNAMEATDLDSQRDNALWYLLRASLKNSLNSTLENLESYAGLWSDASYFDDFFDVLIPQLFSNTRWDAFETLLAALDGFASDEVCAKIAYIYGRLLQEGYARPSRDGVTPEQEIQRAFTRALRSGTDLYYRVMASYQLGYTEFSFDDRPDADESDRQTADVDSLLRGYAYFGLPQKIYSEWLEFYPDVSTDTSMYLADFLQKCGNQKSEYYSQSLRIASRSANTSMRAISEDEQRLVFPHDFEPEMISWSQEYDIIPSRMFALVRTESFFDPEIASSKGAVGLTQLMPSTIADIERALRMQDYSIMEPDTNIRFGAYYLSWTLRRCEGSYLQAFFSYNAGVRKVSQWLTSTVNPFGTKNSYIKDLFLETIPYSETRDYGRKLVAATVMYETLYDNSPDFRSSVESLVF